MKRPIVLYSVVRLWHDANSKTLFGNTTGKLQVNGTVCRHYITKLRFSFEAISKITISDLHNYFFKGYVWVTMI